MDNDIERDSKILLLHVFLGMSMPVLQGVSVGYLSHESFSIDEINAVSLRESLRCGECLLTVLAEIILGTRDDASWALKKFGYFYNPVRNLFGKWIK